LKILWNLMLLLYMLYTSCDRAKRRSLPKFHNKNYKLWQDETWSTQKIAFGIEQDFLPSLAPHDTILLPKIHQATSAIHLNLF